MTPDDIAVIFDSLQEAPSQYRYATIFAADCEPDAIAKIDEDEPTVTHAALALALGFEAEQLRQEAVNIGRDFYPVAYVEAAAQYFNRYPQATFAQLREAGQLESDSIAGID